jgi:hypothetical protein
MNHVMAPREARPSQFRNAAAIATWLRAKPYFAAIIPVALILALGLVLVFHGTGGHATASEAVIYHAPLTEPDAYWEADSFCYFEPGGGYHVVGGHSCTAGSRQDARFTPQDAYYSVQAQQLSGAVSDNNRFGLVLRSQPQSDFTSADFFSISGSGKWSFIRDNNGQKSDLVSPTSSTAIKTGLQVVNTLRVHATGSHFDLFVNGVQVGSADDATYSTGIYGCEGSDGMDALFTNFTISVPR